MVWSAKAFPPAGVIGASPSVRELDRSGFSWSRAKLRIVALVLLVAAAPAALGIAASSPVVNGLSLAWLLIISLLMDRLGRRAAACPVVLSVDHLGILDLRLMPRRIAWQEIAAIYPVDLDRAHVVDLELRWPETTLAGARWRVRIGACCQRAYGVPAVTISMLLLDGDVRDLLDMVARHRPDLLDATNRR
jgi:hypothetical protein